MNTMGRHSGESRNPEEGAGYRIKAFRYDKERRLDTPGLQPAGAGLLRTSGMTINDELDTCFLCCDDKGRVVRHSGKSVKPESRRLSILYAVCREFDVSANSEALRRKLALHIDLPIVQIGYAPCSQSIEDSTGNEIPHTMRGESAIIVCAGVSGIVSRLRTQFWTPAFAGVTTKETLQLVIPAGLLSRNPEKNTGYRIKAFRYDRTAWTGCPRLTPYRGRLIKDFRHDWKCENGPRLSPE